MSTKQMTTREGWWKFVPVLEAREAFKTHGSLKGTDNPQWRFGEMPYEYRDSVKQADYVVYSYSTPIAWHVPNEGWVVPQVKYSTTTTRHQNMISVAVDMVVKKNTHGVHNDLQRWMERH